MTINITREDDEGTITVKAGREPEQSSHHGAVAAAIRNGLVLNQRLDIIKKQLDEHKDIIRAFAESLHAPVSVVTLSTDGAACRVTFKDSVKVYDVDGLKTFLGARFDDLVKTEVEYKPLPALVEKAVDADHGAELRPFLAVKAQTPAVSFLAEDRK